MMAVPGAERHAGGGAYLQALVADGDVSKEAAVGVVQHLFKLLDAIFDLAGEGGG